MIKKSFILIFIAFIVQRTLNASDPIHYIIPNALLFTPFVQFVMLLWKVFDPWGKLHTEKVHRHVNIIQSKDFSFNTLKNATHNFKYPVVVRGLFKDTEAVRYWGDEEYLSKKFDKIVLPYIDNTRVGKYQDFRNTDYFNDIFNEIKTNPNSSKSLFFPVLSRYQLTKSDNSDSIMPLDKLIIVTNKIIHDDLQLSAKIWNGFGTERHKGFYNSQFIIARGSKHMNATTGTGWHAEPGHNYFTQIIGKKRWYLMEPKHSSLMLPLRGGIVNMQTGSYHIANTILLHNKTLSKYLPLLYVDTYPGDLLFVPDWYWHTVQNYEGFNVACPIRELNMTLAFRNNAHYMSIIILNKLVNYLGFDVGGYPPLVRDDST